MFKPYVQITVFIRNKPGRFAELCDLLYARGVDIRAMSVNPDADFGVVRLVVDQVEEAAQALHEEGLMFMRNEVLIAEVPNRAGMAAGIGHRLAQAGVNIEYTYFSGGDENTMALLIFKVADLDSAMEKLADPSGTYN